MSDPTANTGSAITRALVELHGRTATAPDRRRVETNGLTRTVTVRHGNTVQVITTTYHD